MESNPSLSPSPSSASQPSRDAAPRSGAADWQPASGIMDRMLAYRHWWNIPEGRTRPRARSQAVAARNRTAGRAG